MLLKAEVSHLESYLNLSEDSGNIFRSMLWSFSMDSDRASYKPGLESFQHCLGFRLLLWCKVNHQPSFRSPAFRSRFPSGTSVFLTAFIFALLWI